MRAASEREELAMTVHEALIGGPAAAWADLLPIQQKNYLRAADAILAAGFTRQSRAETQAVALTVDEVRESFATYVVDDGDGYTADIVDGDLIEKFDRWLAGHDATVKAEATRDIAHHLESMASDCPAYSPNAATWLRARADQIEAEA